jgi:DNA invertase Pin-like site-specific DNA recombinase
VAPAALSNGIQAKQQGSQGMAIIGYARVSTDEQTTEGQVTALREVGCVEVYMENASGSDRRRPELAKVLRRLEKDDVLTVVRIDRLARSAIHLMEIIEALDKRGVKFRSLCDPIDTTSSSGRFVFQILAAVAEMERAMIRERTVAGMKVARSRGRRIGNPGLIDRDPAAIAKVMAARSAALDQIVLDGADTFLPLVETLRQTMTWATVAEHLNSRKIPRPGSDRPWTRDALIRVTKRLVAAGRLDPRAKTDDHLVVLVAGLSRMDPEATLEKIGGLLRDMGQVTPSGSSRWGRSSVKYLLDKAAERGLLRQG